MNFMKHSIIVWAATMVAVMIVLPLLAVNFVSSNAGMIASILLLLIINPFCAIFTGVLAGKQVRTLWPLPLLLDVLFILGSRFSLGLDFSESLFYSAIYLAIAAVSSVVAAAITHRKEK